MTIGTRANRTAALLILATLLCWPAIMYSQNANQQALIRFQPQAQLNEQTSFEVVSIKPIPTGVSTNHTGFRSLPGGRIDIVGMDIRELISHALHVPTSQIKGGPDWLDTDSYVLQAVPPDTSPTRKATMERSAPTNEQCRMLQSMLADRFSLRYHEVTTSGSAYVLTQKGGPLKLAPPQDPNRKPAFAIFMRGAGFDGEMRGANVSMPAVTAELSFNLNVPVIDKTGLTGSYDFHVEPFAPDNTDAAYAVTNAMSRLGLRLKKESSPLRIVTIDVIQRPTPN